MGSKAGARAAVVGGDSEELDMQLVYRNIHVVAKMLLAKRTKAAEAAFDTQAC